ncbi:MAG: hypothetical protein RMK52_03245 [Chitinophagales bacterium]|nr:hypothetical protein [Chitinophagales bacterium]MDW8393241.1 hypothetical protein [Chitinophagales bacterium]
MATGVWGIGLGAMLVMGIIFRRRGRPAGFSEVGGVATAGLTGAAAARDGAFFSAAFPVTCALAEGLAAGLALDALDCLATALTLPAEAGLLLAVGFTLIFFSETVFFTLFAPLDLVETGFFAALAAAFLDFAINYLLFKTLILTAKSFT